LEKARNEKKKKKLKLPPSLLTIRYNAFRDCEQLTYVTIPSSLESIEGYAFCDCSALAMRDFKLPDTLEELGSFAFRVCSGLAGKLSAHITRRSSFAGCAGLSELDLSNCKEIEDYCFANCRGLRELKLPSSLLYIGYHSFYECIGLTGALIIPPFVKYIHPEAFERCTGLINVDQTIAEHFLSFESWKARGNVLMTLIAFDEEYRRVVEKNGGRLHSALSNSFLSGISKDAQLIYKAAAHVDGTDNLANGICRLIISFLPVDRRYYGTVLSNED
jgi:hypothetical protein